MVLQLRFVAVSAFDLAHNTCDGILCSGNKEWRFAGVAPPSCSPLVTYSALVVESGAGLSVKNWLEGPCTVHPGLVASPANLLNTLATPEMKKALVTMLRTKTTTTPAQVVALALDKRVHVLPSLRGDDHDVSNACRGMFDLVHVVSDPDLWSLYLAAFAVIGRSAAKHLNPVALRLIAERPAEALFPTASTPLCLQDVDFASSPDVAYAAAAKAQGPWRQLRKFVAFGNTVKPEHVLDEYGAAIHDVLVKHKLFELLQPARTSEHGAAVVVSAVHLAGLLVQDNYESQSSEPTTYRETVNTGFTTWFAARAGLCRTCLPRQRCYAVHETAGLVFVEHQDTVKTSKGLEVSTGGLTFVCQVPADLAHTCIQPQSLDSIGLYSGSPQTPELSWNKETLTYALGFVKPDGKVYVWGRFDKLRQMLEN